MQASPRRRGGAARSARFVACVVALVVMGNAACASPSPVATESLTAMLAEREQVAAEVHADGTARLATYLRDKWGPVSLPQSAIERWVPAGQWATIMAECLEIAGFAGVVASEGGERLDFSGLMIVEPRQLYAFDVATFDCQSRYPVLAWYRTALSEVEAPWAYVFTREVTMPCLLAAGYPVPPSPDEEQFAAAWRTAAPFDPLAVVGDVPAARARAAATCPPADSVLGSLP